VETIPVSPLRRQLNRSSCRQWCPSRHAGANRGWCRRRGRRRARPTRCPTSMTSTCSGTTRRSSASSEPAPAGRAAGQPTLKGRSGRRSRRRWCTTTPSPGGSGKRPGESSWWTAPRKGWCSWRPRPTCGWRSSGSRCCRRIRAWRSCCATLVTSKPSLEDHCSSCRYARVTYICSFLCFFLLAFA
jgi:hypothetical protein